MGRIFLLSALTIMAGLLYPGHPAVASGGIPSAPEMQNLLSDIKVQAEQQLIQSRGQAAVGNFKAKFSQKYPLSQYPLPARSSCSLFHLPPAGAPPQPEISDRAAAYAVTGIEAILLGDPLLGKWCFANAASISSDCPLYLSNLAFALNLNEEYSTALKLLTYARHLDPADSGIRANMGYSLYRLEEYEAAVREYLAAIVQQPEFTAYHQYLLAVQQKMENSADFWKQYIQDLSPSGQAQGLDQALSMLEESKQKEFQKELEQEMAFWESFQRESPRYNPRIDPAERFGSDFSALAGLNLSTAGYPFSNFCEMASFLDQRASETKAFPPYYILFKGYAREAAELCGDRNLLAEIDESASRDLRGMSELYKPDEPKPREEHFQTLYLGPISLAKGSKGTYKLGISAGVVGGEWSYNAKTYDVGAKVSLGPKLKFGIGPVGGEAGVEAYFQCDLAKGPVTGIESSNAVSLAGQQLKSTQSVAKISLVNALSPSL